MSDINNEKRNVLVVDGNPDNLITLLTQNGYEVCQANTKKKAIDTLSDDIIHDFNNILTIINTCSQLVIADISQDHDTYIHIKKIVKASERASKLVNQLLGTIKQNKEIIHLESKPHQKITGDISCPMNTNIEQHPSRKQTPVIPENEHILLIDDEKDVLYTVKLLLEHIGYKVTAFDKPVEAFNLLKNNPESFDIAIIDFCMPEMNGKQLAKQIKKIRNDLPLLISSGNKPNFSEKEINELGISGFLEKPFLKKDLSETIRQTLSASIKKNNLDVANG